MPRRNRGHDAAFLIVTETENTPNSLYAVKSFLPAIFSAKFPTDVFIKLFGYSTGKYIHFFFQVQFKRL